MIDDSAMPPVNEVQLFIPCFIDQVYPEVALATVDVLKRLGCRPLFPEDQICCGQPFFNSGYRDEARRVAGSWLQSFDPELPIVCPSGSCTSMVRVHYPELFEEGPEADLARDLGRNTFEFTEFIVEQLKVEDLGTGYSTQAVYHPSCHQTRELNKPEPPLKLLANVRDLELIDFDQAAECCGFGGTFAVKFPRLSEQIGRDKLLAIEETGANCVVGTDMSCLMHLEALARRMGLNISVRHVAQLI
jgi:L-lactate dehydrogenase complex protein LldE